MTREGQDLDVNEEESASLQKKMAWQVSGEMDAQVRQESEIYHMRMRKQRLAWTSWQAFNVV